MTITDQAFFELQTALRGRFSIEQEIGRGGMGIVYLARDVQLERDVAIKMLAPTLAASADMRRRFLREARLAAQCFHPHIVPIHAVEESGPLAWFVMAYVRGESLAERVRRAGALDTGSVRRLAQDIGWALSYAHGRGVVHRDVKPENILIDAVSERFLIADFGIARAHADTVSSHSDAAGTPRYMAPEQALGDSIDGRADLYALGATLFFAATGRPPFEATSAVALVMQHASMPAPSVQSIAPALDAGLGDAIDRCLAKLPDDRFINAEAFVRAVQPLPPNPPIPPALLPVRSNADSAKTLLGLAAAVAVSTIPLALGEAPGSFGRGIISTLGTWLAMFLSTISVFRAGEAVNAALHALERGHTPVDVTHALAGDVDSTSSTRAQWRGAILTTVGIAVALAQGYASELTWIPGPLASIVGAGMAFGPAYLIARGVSGATRGTALQHWLQKRVVQPLARSATRLLVRFTKIPAGRVALPRSEAATEFRLGEAVQVAIDRLPANKQQLFGDAPRVAHSLALDAERLRKRDAALADEERLARAVTDSSIRASMLAQVAELRQGVQGRLATTIAALETLRLDLLRLDTGDSDSNGLTAQLEAVRDLARRVDADVELRAYLEQSGVTPT